MSIPEFFRVVLPVIHRQWNVHSHIFTLIPNKVWHISLMWQTSRCPFFVQVILRTRCRYKSLTTCCDTHTIFGYQYDRTIQIIIPLYQVPINLTFLPIHFLKRNYVNRIAIIIFLLLNIVTNYKITKRYLIPRMYPNSLNFTNSKW